MKKRELFGTDGVRGVANQELSVHLSLRIARAAATVLRRQGDARPCVVMGRDTRISGEMIAAAMTAGFCSAGADVIDMGVMPTAGIAYLAQVLDVDLGAVISASHNPFEFNGIKFFSHEGFKLPDDVELAIEERVNSTEHLDHPLGDKIGRVIPAGDNAEKYLDYLRKLAPDGLAGLHLVVDCANGAASHIAPALLRELGAKVTEIHCEPDGININEGCGATHVDVVMNAVKELGADAGLSFDGDADRLMMADELGQKMDGDHIMAMVGYILHQQGKLACDCIVGTVMSNLGFERALQQMGIEMVRTQVGDRYVLEEMQRRGAAIGGEQSGHLIFLEESTTGDGLVTALVVLSMLRASGKKLSYYHDMMKDYPQKLINVTVTSVKGWETHADIMNAIAAAETDLGTEGRILVRASGTEPKIRVMIEALDQAKVDHWTPLIADIVKKSMV
ncbi:MAG: phosphoglucosamine mutase [bacterium]